MNRNGKAYFLILLSVLIGAVCLLNCEGEQATMWFVAAMLMNFLNVRLP